MSTIAVSLALAAPAASVEGSGAAVAQEPRSTVAPPSRTAAPEHCPAALRALRFYSAKAAEWRAKMGAGVTAEPARATDLRPGATCPRIIRAALEARTRARRARAAFERWYEQTYEKWRCIHEHEAAWNDPNPPHYGGLQFDDDFQRTYGPEFFRRWGDAGNWPVWAQLVAAERAYRTRGFGPWPNTRRMCGL